MNREQEVFKRINIAIYQLAESIENGDVEMGWFKKNTDEIDELINNLNNKYYE